MNFLEQQNARICAEQNGLYRSEDEHASCGVGLIAALDGAPRREIVDMAIAALKAVWHRGAVDADGKTGDGAGLRLNVPQDMFKSFVSRTGHEADKRDVCVGQIFLPRTDFTAQDAARAIVESEILRSGFSSLRMEANTGRFFRIRRQSQCNKAGSGAGAVS